MVLFLSLLIGGLHLRAAQPGSGLESYLYDSYEVHSYVIEGKPLLATNILTRPPAHRRQGYDTMNIVIAPRRITNGLVPLDIFPGAVAQVVVAGERYLMSTNGLEADAAAQITTALANRAAAATQ